MLVLCMSRRQLHLIIELGYSTIITILAILPIIVTLAGIVTDANNAHAWKAF